ncbi:nuclear transport factor 2 family protein [Flavobacterium sp. MC2016-06]|jgi:hypothetical protein|uniref:nuclear transport factor 2 family protein n=1 Tax=Flavobacterium sp. MC2016-06 TaxID=2676308 RepID=UPI0012BA6838|nr:nuclear transport factor 2 family protein [Flavobacterium sp. MC2016-06]MBU3861091.1 nuclear transport factor 2 family protein [Flavobacterium sp. MC2016-06]
MKKSILLFFIFLAVGKITAQTNEEVLKMAQLKTEIVKMDSLLFTVAFNECKIDLFKKIMADDLEFYDDRSGLSVSKENEIKSFLERCGRTEKLTRKLNSCTVDKLGDFGAVQLGEHTFLVNGVPVGTAKFIHIWERKNNEWILKRIVSYGHRGIKK